jgi:hypothetical protein
MGRFMKYAVKIGSGGTIDVSNSLKICSGIPKFLRGGIYTWTQRHIDSKVISKAQIYFTEKGKQAKNMIFTHASK